MGHVQSAGSTLGTDLSAGTDTSRAATFLKTDVTSLQSDVQTAQANPPPTCVPHLTADPERRADQRRKGRTQLRERNQGGGQRELQRSGQRSRGGHRCHRYQRGDVPGRDL